MVKIGMLSAGLLVLVLASPVQAQPGCDRACLEGHVSTFLEALYANTPEAVGLAAGARISNNNSLVGLQEAFWDGAVETAYRWDIANPRLGDVATEVVIRNSDDSYTMARSRAVRSPTGS